MNEQNGKLDVNGVDDMFDNSYAYTRSFTPEGRLFCGDCHKILSGRNHRYERYIPDNSIDLVCFDPPFGDDEKYNVICNGNMAQRVVYNDMWRWNVNTTKEYKILKNMNTDLSKEIIHFKQMLNRKDPNLFAYLVYLGYRLVDSYEVLKPTGTIYLHCNSQLGFRIKTLMDGIFGEDNFRDVITWSYTKVGGTRKKYRKSSDMIFMYTKGKKYTFNLDDVRKPYSDSTIKSSKRDDAGLYYTRGLGTDKTIKRIKKTYFHPGGCIRSTVWDDIPWTLGKERLGPFTQKPEALLKIMIKASSNEGDVVLDPMCGVGTSLIAAEKLNRKWIGIEATYELIDMIKQRFKTWHPWIRFGPVDGYPLTLEDLDRDYLSMDGLTRSEKQEKYTQFQWLVMDLIKAQPRGKMNHGGDGNIDAERTVGLLREPVRILYQIKSGKNVDVGVVQQLDGTVDQNEAQIGVLIVRYPDLTTTAYENMKGVAAQMGLYNPSSTITEHPNSIPKIQVFGIGELMDARNNGRPSPIILPELPDITVEREEQEIIFEGRGTRQESSGTQDLPLGRFE